MLRVFRKSALIRDWLAALDLDLSGQRLLSTVIMMFWTGHLMACFWYMAASLEDNIYHTWVGEKGVVDLVEEAKDYVYFNSCYWAFQTVSTVGYGDFTI